MESAYKNVGFNKLFAVRAKKNGIPLYPNLVNLKSNTMKNTMQRYGDFDVSATIPSGNAPYFFLFCKF